MEFPGRFAGARQFALERRVLLARTKGGVDLDFALGAFPFEEGTIQRSTQWRINDSLAILTCCAEDLVVHKVFAGRDRDWADVEGILERQHGRLELEHVPRAPTAAGIKRRQRIAGQA
jgi:hypothetical protein